MKFADAYDEFDIDEAELINDDFEGHLIAEAHRIVAGDSVDPPTVDMLAALIRELASVRESLRGVQNHCPEDIPF